MRILHVTRETAADRRFGIGRSLAPLFDALRRRGHELQYLTQDDLGARARQARDDWTRRLKALLRPMAGAAWESAAALWVERLNMGRLAAKVAARSRVDVVNLHDPLLACGYRMARSVHRGPSCRWGVTQHGFGSYSWAISEEGIPYTTRLLRWTRRLEANVLAAADWVICPTPAGRMQLARDLAVAEPPAHWVALPHPRPELDVPDRQVARRALGWDEHTVHVVAVGRMNPVKRMDAVVRACLAQSTPMHLTVLGDDAAPDLQSLLLNDGQNKLTLELRCVDDVAPYLAGCDIYVSASRNESFGMANLEALRCGAAALCTAVGAVPEVTGGRAFLVPGADDTLVVALSQALTQLRDDAPRRRAMGAAGRNWAAAWPDADTLAQRHEELYLRLV